jgi:hypothetical protein
MTQPSSSRFVSETFCEVLAFSVVRLVHKLRAEEPIMSRCLQYALLVIGLLLLFSTALGFPWWK